MIWTIVEIIVGVFLLVSFFYGLYVGFQAEVWGRIYLSLERLHFTDDNYTFEGWRKAVKIYVISLASEVLSAVALLCLGLTVHDKPYITDIATSLGIVFIATSVFDLSRFIWPRWKGKKFSLRAKAEVKNYFLSRKKKVV
jgi:hypothetical protein